MLTAYLKRQWKLLLLLAGAVAVFAAVFALYSRSRSARPGAARRL